MDRIWPFSVDAFGKDPTNPDHTGWCYPGLQQAAPPADPEINHPAGVKLVFYTVYKLQTLPFRRLRKICLQSIYGQSTHQFVRPAALHRDEGSQANLYRLYLAIV